MQLLVQALQTSPGNMLVHTNTNSLRFNTVSFVHLSIHIVFTYKGAWPCEHNIKVMLLGDSYFHLIELLIAFAAVVENAAE